MEVTAAAAQAATYTSNKSLAEQINDYLATTKTSIATLASEIPGYSRPTISRYLSGKYEGDIAAIEKLLADWLAGRTGEDVALPEPGRKTGTKPAFFESRDALKVLGVCQSCQEYIGLGIVVARSGYGKTYSLRQYAKLPRVAYIECDDTMSSRDLVEAIERALGIPSGYGTIWRRVNGIRDYFNTNKGYLLIIDEADKLVSKYNLIQIIPYVLVLIGGIIGINVFVVLLIGIVSGAVIALATGATGQTGILAVKALLENMGSGAAGMFETSMVAILVSAICALIREYGGFEALLGWIKKAFRGKRGGQIGMGLLVGAMDIATANNTVAIVMANPIAKEMSEEYGITPRKAASILDTFSCIFQGIIPYGAQMLVAISAAHELGYAISAFDIIPNLFYPYLLAVCSFFFIAIDSKKKA